MERDFKAQILDVLDRYVEATGSGIPGLGANIMSDTRFFERLRTGKSCTIDSAFKVLRWFSTRWPDNAEWPADVLRPSPEVEDAA